MTPRPEPTDQRFAHFCRTGDAQALGEVFDGTAKELLHVALWLGGNRADAEDLLQRTFLCAIETRRKFRPGSAAMPWLLGLLAREARRLRRERARRPAAATAAAERPRDPEGEAAARELAASVRAVAGELAEPYGPVLTLHLEQGCNAKEIAARLRRPAGTVRTQLMRALEMLRRRLPTGFVAGVLPFAPGSAPSSPAALAAVRAQVLAHCTPAAGALALTATGGTLMLKKLALLVPVAALLLGLGAFALWPEAPAPAAPPAPTNVLAATAPVLPSTTTAAAPVADRAAVAPPPPADPGFASLRVTVRWSDDLSPAASVGVFALDELYRGLSRRDAITDAQGRCELRHLAPGPAHVASSHSLSSTATDLRAGDGNSLELRATRTATVRGRVVDADGRPVADARLWLSDHGTWRTGHELGRSAADGTFALPLAGDHYLGARKQGYAESLWLHLAAELPQEPIELRLRADGGTVRGTVRDPRGEPVARAKVLVGRPSTWVVPGSMFEQRRSNPMGQLVESDDHGDYAAEGVACGAVDVWAWAGEFAPWYGGVLLQPGATARVDVTFAPGAVVTGTARDVDGAPAAAAAIAAGAPELPFRASAHAGADGRYRLAGLPAGRVGLFAARDRARASATLELVAGGEAAWDPTLVAARTIRGRVLGDDDRPLADLEVLAGAPPQPEATARTDDDGRFVLEPHDDAPVQVVVQQLDFDLASVDDVRPGTDDLVIRVRADDLPNARIALRVIDERGQPVAAKIGPKRRGASQWRLFDDDPATGKATLAPLPPGEYQLDVHSDGFGDLTLPPARLAARQTLDLGDVVLRAPGRATFTVLPPPGSPLVQTMLLLYDEQGQFLANLQLEQGRAEAKALRPGRLFALCMGPLGEAGATVDVPSAGEVHVELQLQPTVRSTLRFRSPVPWTKQSSVQFFVFRADGSFAALGGTLRGQPEGIVDLSPGSYRLDCRGDDSARASVDLVVPAQNPGPTLDVELRAK